MVGFDSTCDDSVGVVFQHFDRYNFITLVCCSFPAPSAGAFVFSLSIRLLLRFLRPSFVDSSTPPLGQPGLQKRLVCDGCGVSSHRTQQRALQRLVHGWSCCSDGPAVQAESIDASSAWREAYSPIARRGFSIRLYKRPLRIWIGDASYRPAATIDRFEYFFWRVLHVDGRSHAKRKRWMWIARHARLGAVVRLATAAKTPERCVVERIVCLRFTMGIRAVDILTRTPSHLFPLHRRPLHPSTNGRRRAHLPCTPYGRLLCVWIQESIHASVGCRENAITIRPSREDSLPKDVKDKAKCTTRKGHHVMLAKTSCIP